MKPNSQFLAAIHILTLLELKKTFVSSDFLSVSSGLNPVTVRRLLLRLKVLGLVESKKGSDGGSKLAVPAETISLRSVYEGFREGSLYGAYPEHPHPACPVGGGLSGILEKRLDSAYQAFLRELENTSIVALARELSAGNPP